MLILLKLPPAIGKQVLSKSRSAPRVLMAGRVKLAGDRAESGQDAPGPCYVMPDSVGPQVESTKRGIEYISFGTAPRANWVEIKKIHQGQEHIRSAPP